VGVGAAELADGADPSDPSQGEQTGGAL